MHHIATNEYHRIKYHISVKRLFVYLTLNNFKSLQFLVSISIEFLMFTPICSVCIYIYSIYIYIYIITADTPLWNDTEVCKSIGRFYLHVLFDESVATML